MRLPVLENNRGLPCHLVVATPKQKNIVNKLKM